MLTFLKIAIGLYVAIVLFAAGVIIAMFGDTAISKKSFIGKALAWFAGRAKYMKIVFWAALICAGVAILVFR